MAGQEAHESRKEVAKRLNELECTKGQPKAKADSPHGEDHYNEKSHGSKHKGMK